MIGGFSESMCAEDAATYFSGYIAPLKLIHFHKTKLGCGIESCNSCENILGPVDLNLHILNSFKEYKDNAVGSLRIKYCFKDFVDTIMSFERLFCTFSIIDFIYAASQSSYLIPLRVTVYVLSYVKKLYRII